MAPIARGSSEDKARTVRFSWCGTGGSDVFFSDCPLEGRGLSARCSQTFSSSLADCPPGLSQDN
jgi:hypothetical protein